MLVVLCGLAVRALTIGRVPPGTSGRITKRLRADVLNQEGLYSVVRNPLYFGNLLVFLGVTLMAQSWEIALINLGLFTLAYLPIVLTEERFLADRFGAQYEAYCASVPCFVPNLRLHRRASAPFRWRMVLRREPNTWMSAATALLAVELLREWTITGSLDLHTFWIVLAAAVTSGWVLLKSLKRWTRVLVVPPVQA